MTQEPTSIFFICSMGSSPESVLFVCTGYRDTINGVTGRVKEVERLYTVHSEYSRNSTTRGNWSALPQVNEFPLDFDWQSELAIRLL